MERIVYLARHGETEWNRVGRWQGHTDIVLSDVGRAQAAVLAKKLVGRGVGAVRASDLARARETAEIVARALGVGEVAVDPDLRERSFGCFEGLTRAECQLRFPSEWAAYRADPGNTPPGAEAHMHVIARMRAAVGRAAAAQGSDPLLFVTHGGAMRALVGSITGAVPPPLQNGALFRLLVRDDGFGAVDRID